VDLASAEQPEAPVGEQLLGENPRGFGLLQRGRDFSHYEDLDDNYHKRPSAWIEPQGDWGKGTVDLVEIPTADETNDNIVAFWSPETLPEPLKPSLCLSPALDHGRSALHRRTAPGPSRPCARPVTSSSPT
jgi:glucan biosynthesis protein